MRAVVAVASGVIHSLYPASRGDSELAADPGRQRPCPASLTSPRERGRSRPDLRHLLELRQVCPDGPERRQLDALIKEMQNRAKALATGESRAGSPIAVHPKGNGRPPNAQGAPRRSAAKKSRRYRPTAQNPRPGDTAEMRWLVRNSRTLERYRGEWLLLRGSALVAHDHDFRVLQTAIDARKIDSPFVYYVPTNEESKFVPA